MFFLTIPIMGLFVSLVSVFIGLGGGIVLVPLLPSIFRLNIHESVATSLFTIFFVVSENTYRFHKEKQELINWPVVFLMGPVAAFMAMISAKISQKVNPDRILDVLAIILVLIALKNLFSSFFLSKNYEILPLEGRKKIFSIGGGALAGLTSGFTGIGSGVILSPVMIFLKTVKPVQLVPTANASMVFATLGACLSLLIDGQPVRWNQWGPVRWDIALGLFVSASFFSSFFRLHQDKLSLKIKSILLSLVLGGLIFKIFYIRVHWP